MNKSGEKTIFAHEQKEHKRMNESLGVRTRKSEHTKDCSMGCGFRSCFCFDVRSHLRIFCFAYIIFNSSGGDTTSLRRVRDSFVVVALVANTAPIPILPPDPILPPIPILPPDPVDSRLVGAASQRVGAPRH